MGDRGGYRRKREKKIAKDNGVGEMQKKRINQKDSAPGKKIYHHGFDEYNKL